MALPSKASLFRDAPLLTPARLLAPGWERCFDVLPEWAQGRTTIIADTVFFTVDGKPPLAIGMPRLEAALALELTRYGHAMVSNASSNRPGAYVCVKYSIWGRSKDTMPLRRVLSGANKAKKAVRAEIECDYSAANVAFKPDAHAKKEARVLALFHAERLATEVMGLPFDTGPYAENIRALYRAIDDGVEREREHRQAAE